MNPPWWNFLAIYLALLTFLAPAIVLCAPIPLADHIDASVKPSPPEPRLISFDSFTTLGRRSPAPTKGKGHASHAPSTHGSSPAHSSSSSRHGTPHPPHTKLHAEDLKYSSSRYRRIAKEAHPKADWDHEQADHLLEAQTVSSAINEHLEKEGGEISHECLEALKAALNTGKNLYPLSKTVNLEKGAMITAFAKHDESAVKDLKISKDLTAYLTKNRRVMLSTANDMDAALSSQHCKQSLGETHKLVKGGVISGRAKEISKHAADSRNHHKR